MPYFQVLAAQDRIRTAQSNIASAIRILRRYQAAVSGRDRDRSRRRPAGTVVANQRALVPPLRQTLDQNINALATLVSRPPEAVRVMAAR